MKMRRPVRIPTLVVIKSMLFVVSVLFTMAMAQSHDVTMRHHDLVTSILDDIEVFNASCLPKDSCRLDKSRMSDLPDLEKRNCLCDDLCPQFGDCCLDSKRFGLEQQQVAAARFSCLQFKQYNYNWIVNKCPADWVGTDVALACETEAAEWQVHLDPIGHMPVTSTITGVTYRNINCAVCNRDTPGSRDGDRLPQLRFWNPRLECNSILAGNSLLSKVTKEVLASKVQWDTELKMWGLTVDIDGRGEQFQPCFVDPSLPEDLQSYLRPCQPSTNDCPPIWTDKGVREKCRSYTSYVYRPQEVFRNVHCAICNGVEPLELSCNSSGISFRQLPFLRDFNPSAFALLFDLKDNDGNGIVGQQKSCQDGQLYDPFSRKCRQVFCSQAGTVYRDGRCLKYDSSSTSSSTTSTSSTTLDSYDVDSTDRGVIQFPDAVQPDMVATSTIGPMETPTTALPLTTQSTRLTSSTDSFAHPWQPRNATTTAVNGSSAGSETTTSEIDFASCPKFLMSEDEVQWLDDGFLYVPLNNKTYPNGHYQKEKGGGVLICAYGLSTVSKFDPVLGWVTVAGLGLSEICLALHLIAFIISPELRNLSGRNLASLSLALFAAYGSFIAAQFVPVGGSICIGVALSTFYFFLSAFWWTSVLAWDVWRTIRLATVQLRCSSSGQQWGKFALYSLYAWLVPGLIVTAAVLVEYVDLNSSSWIPAEYHPNFGRNVCWFGQRKAILVYFAAPLAAVLFVNLLLFINSMYMIRSTTAKSPTSSNQASGSRRQLGLYIRLALIMGLSWIAGLIAGAADFMPLWYVFVALCSLQGVFILLAYTCNPKVARSIRHRVLFCHSAGQRRQSTYRTALVGGLKGEHVRRLGLEARDSHDSVQSSASNTSQASQTSQTSLTKCNNSSTTP